MEQKGTIRNKKTGKPYEVTRSQWETIRSNPGFAADYEVIKDFPPVVDLADLPEVIAINNPPVETPPEEPAIPPTEDDPTDLPPAEEPPAKTGKKRNDKA